MSLRTAVQVQTLGYDAVVLHEHDIRKPRGAYSFLQNANRRKEFLADLSELMEAAPFTLIAAVIRKADLGQQYHAPENHYSIAMEFGLERLFKHLEGLARPSRQTDPCGC